MPSDYRFGYYFFAPNGRFEPCGMFTLPHIIAVIACLAIVLIAITKTRNKLCEDFIQKLLRTNSIILTILEIIKICHSFIYGDLYLDAWFPLSYCGLFIFALWMAGFGKGHIKNAGESFIAYGCPIAGIAFLIFPTTSLMSYPVWHYFSLYSLFFHSLMIYTGLSLLYDRTKFKSSVYISYVLFILPFSMIAVIMNSIYGCNLMNLREPYNIPIDFLQNLYANFNIGYTVLVVFIYLLIPLITAGIGKALTKK